MGPGTHEHIRADWHHQAADRIIDLLRLTFVADKPLSFYACEQVALAAAGFLWIWNFETSGRRLK
jgi:hypothetical protein